MNEFTTYLNKVEMILNNHQRPEIDLIELYRSYDKEQQLLLVTAMTGKLIEQKKRLFNARYL